jgi:hypothetical protein
VNVGDIVADRSQDLLGTLANDPRYATQIAGEAAGIVDA